VTVIAAHAFFIAPRKNSFVLLPIRTVISTFSNKKVSFILFSS